jgi:carboxylate-amine ligase
MVIDFGKEEEVNTRALIYELLEFVDPVVGHLGSRHRLAYVHKILEHGTGADRQLAVFEKTKNLVSVVEYIQASYLAGI